MMPSPLSKRRSSMKGVKNMAIRRVPRTTHSLLLRIKSPRVRQLQRQLGPSTPSRPSHLPLLNEMPVQTVILVPMKRLQCSLLPTRSSSLLTITTPPSNASPHDSYPLSLSILQSYVLLNFVLTLMYLLMILELSLSLMLIQLPWVAHLPLSSMIMSNQFASAVILLTLPR